MLRLLVATKWLTNKSIQNSKPNWSNRFISGIMEYGLLRIRLVLENTIDSVNSTNPSSMIPHTIAT